MDLWNYADRIDARFARGARKHGHEARFHRHFDAGEIIVARTGGFTVQIELEALTERATRMRVVTRDGGFFYDAATANEIVAQTQKMLEARRATASVPGAKHVNSFD